jgi:hypothetical protein
MSIRINGCLADYFFSVDFHFQLAVGLMSRMIESYHGPLSPSRHKTLVNHHFGILEDSETSTLRESSDPG